VGGGIGMRKVKMVAGEDRHISDEYVDATGHFIDIITEVAKKYIDLDKYEIYTENWSYTVHEGLPLEYSVQYLDVYLIDKATEKRELIGGVDIGDDRWDHVDPEDGEDTVALYSDDKVRDAAEDLFAEYAAEVEA
jgi:hypothetical protein